MHSVAAAGRRLDRTGTVAGTARVVVLGAAGYTGQELLRLLSRHPAVNIVAATSSSHTSTPRRLPGLRHLWDGSIVPLDIDAVAAGADVAFLALPDAAAADIAPTLTAAGLKVIDLSGAFRLRSADVRARWYPETHEVPAVVAYGLTERNRPAIANASMVANPGCYPTAALLPLGPLADAGFILPYSDIIVDAKSGVSGAGKTPSERTHFSECHGSVSAYGVFNHRHAAEIEQGLDRSVTFTPHLVPLDRGILATIYVRVPPGTTEAAVGDLYSAAYGGSPFVRLTGDSLPEIKHVAHTNFCDIGWRVDPSGRATLVSVIDNLLKGASGQAVQNMNVMLGVDERTGLL